MPNATPSPTRRKRRAFAALLTALATLALAAPASAAAPDLLWQTPADNITPGSGAGQLNNPRGMVADPDTGHLYVADLNNARISEFTAWGTFVKAWGWDVAPEGAPGDTPSDQLEVCTTACQAGSKGTGAGQVNIPTGLTRDAAGDLYVQETPSDNSSKRVQKFSPSGQFILTFGGQVNETAVQEREEQEANSEPVTVTPQEENLCTAASGDTCGAGVSGTADGYFSTTTVGNYLTFNSQTGTLFAGDKDRIQEFGTDGTFKGKINFDVPGDLEAFDGKAVQALAADPKSGDLYLLIAPFSEGLTTKIVPNVFRLDPASGEVVDELEVNQPATLAVDVDGNVYVTEADGVGESGNSLYEVLGFDSSGKPVEGMEAGDEFAEPPPFSSQSINGLATNVAAPGSSEPGNLYVDYFSASNAAYINAYGPPPLAFEDPPLVPPSIGEQFAVSADSDAAVVKAEINPRFWDDVRFRVQYGTEECVEGGGWEAACVSEEPAAPGTLLTAKATNALLTTPGVLLAGLEPDTTYRYRFAARSTGSGGEDVFGEGGTLVSDGTDATFTTFPTASPPNTDCSNQAFRTGPGAKLPDCRAYEMVSPLEKNNGDIRTKTGRGIHQSSLSGSSFTYSTATPFGEGASGTYISQYMARRDPATGWQSEAISPPRTRTATSVIGLKFATDYKLFSADLCSGWLRMAYDPPLTVDAVPNHLNLYRRDNCGAGLGGYEALTTVAPPVATTVGYFGLEVQGLSADGSTALIAAEDALTPDAPPQPAKCITFPECQSMLYLHSAGEPLRYLCYQPNGKPFNPELSPGSYQACFAGTTADAFGAGHFGSLRGALSADGGRVYFSVRNHEGSANEFGSGRIFLRLVEEEKTLRVSQTASGDDAFFWGAAEDGSAALFEIDEQSSPLDGSLFRFDAEKEDSELIAEKSLGVLGASEDLSRVYFVSKEALPGSGQNSEGEEAQAGQPNLYLYEAGEPPTYSFIGATSAAEIATGVSLATKRPVDHRARVSADGLHVAFMSKAPLTGFDNTDLNTGAPAAEVFLYDAESNELRCVSCNPSGVRPNAGDLFDFEENLVFKEAGVAAAQIPGYNTALYPSRVLSEDGTRLFFESFEALVTRDTNGVLDVYEWEKAGAGDCDEADSTFNEEAGGCVSLISSGESPQASRFRDASPNGNDVFFATLSSLLPQDYGLIDIYDARVGGGFAQPTEVPGCEGEACQGPVVAPDDPTPGSSTFEGSGNVSEPPRPTKCAKGRRAVRKAGKTRCVKKPRKAKRAKRANTTRRAGR